MNNGTDVRIKVLLIDDDPRYLELVAVMLEGEGFDVVCAADSAQCGEHLVKNTPDVMIIDVMLGQDNGIEVSKRLRMTESGRDLPIIFVSAWTGRNEMSLPRNSIKLFKPFTQSEIVSAIKSVTRHVQVES